MKAGLREPLDDVRGGAHDVAREVACENSSDLVGEDDGRDIFGEGDEVVDGWWES